MILPEVAAHGIQPWWMETFQRLAIVARSSTMQIAFAVKVARNRGIREPRETATDAADAVSEPRAYGHGILPDQREKLRRLQAVMGSRPRETRTRSVNASYLAATFKQEKQTCRPDNNRGDTL